MNRDSKLLIANTIWFLAWIMAIVCTNSSLWWIILPTVCHWKPSDL